MLFFLIALFSFILQLFLPWWIVGVVAFGLAFRRGRSMRYSFVSAFLAIFCLWCVVALSSSLPNHNILAGRIAGLFGLPDFRLNWAFMVIISGLVGGLAAGLCGMAGFFVRRAWGFEKEDRGEKRKN